jgi:hypothetical protein
LQGQSRPPKNSAINVIILNYFCKKWIKIIFAKNGLGFDSNCGYIGYA